MGVGEVGLVVKNDSSIAEKAALRVASFLEERGVRVLVDNSVKYESLSSYSRFSVEAAPLERIIVVGGDGTLLRTFLRLRRGSPLFMGIKAGKRGFLLDVERYEIEDRLSDFLRGAYRVVEYPRIRVYVGGSERPCVFNDVTLLSKMAKLVRLKIYIDGHLAMNIDGDGVVVSTTAGSTAYSLSAGGPLIDPRLDVTIITPLNPVQLHLRPIVAPGDSFIDVEVSQSSNPLYMNLDGQIAEEVGPGSYISLRRCESRIRIARFRWWENYYERLYTRLLSYW